MLIKILYRNGILQNLIARPESKELPDIPILVLTTYDTDEWVFDALREGAKGYLLKDTPRENLVAAIKGTIEGKSFLDPSVAGKVIQASTQSARQSMR